jgi:hypothetical protein
MQRVDVDDAGLDELVGDGARDRSGSAGLQRGLVRSKRS